MIMTYAMRAGFSGGVVVDWPHRFKFFFSNFFYKVYLRSIKPCCFILFPFCLMRCTYYMQLSVNE